MFSGIIQKKYECQHYKRGCDIFTKCCKKWYHCNKCHNDENTHKLNIKDIDKIKCLYCLKIQKPKQYCSNAKCKKCLGAYFCNICMIYTDEVSHKKIFHCNDCNVCLYGDKLIIKHCHLCNYCYVNSESDHTCIPNTMKNNCSICLDFMGNNEQEITILECGHAIHTQCMNDYIESVIIIEKQNIITCPICRKVLIDLDKYAITNYETENNLYHNSSNVYNVLEENILEDSINNYNEYSNIDRISMEISEIIREMTITNLINQNLVQNIT